MADDILTLTINGQKYEGWTDIRVSRGIEHCAGEFDISVSERWAVGSNPAPWQIKPFDSCVIAIAGETVLTGYVDAYVPEYNSTGHRVRVQGRSKTEDLIDCMPDIKGGQFKGYTLDRIARALAQPFSVDVVVKADVGEAFKDAQIERTEAAYAFLERLCKMRGVLACDDENGALVLTVVGQEGAAGALVEGENILSASAKLSAHERFSNYVVLAQAPVTPEGDASLPHVVGKATDAGCPRFRRFAEMAETPGDNAIAQKRAEWRAKHNFGKAAEATISVQGWRQPKGALWKINTLADVTSPRLELARQMLIGKVTYLLDDRGGRRTELLLNPPEAYDPAPDAKAKHKRKGNSANWANFG